MLYGLTTRLLFLISVANAVTCYYPDGTVSHDGWTPCNPSASVSTCCSPADYCLSNGLCFQAGANNLLATQGCTDPNWGAPCHAFCKPVQSFGNGLFPCPTTTNGAATYCCGPDSSTCCQNGSSFPVPVGSIVLRLGDHSTSSTSSSTSSTSATILTTGSSSITSTTSTSTASSTPSESLDTKSLAIGLGVGIPLGLALIAVVAFGMWELRRYNNARMVPAGLAAIQPTDGGYFPKQNAQELSGNFYGSELDGRSQLHELPLRNS